MSTRRDTGEPDAFMVEVNARQVQQIRRRVRIALPIVALTVAATVAIVALTEAHWSWVLLGAATAWAVIGASLFGPDVDAERPRPDTALEVAVVVGVELAGWRNASADEQHRVRVIARPIGAAASDVVHAYHRFRPGDGWHARPGTLVGIHRFPTMRHLVWLAPRPDPVELARLREDIRQPSPLEDAQVVSLRVTGEYDGQWWPTEVTVRAGDGGLLVSTCRRLPEELGPLGPGSAVRILRDQPDPLTRATRCGILPIGDQVRFWPPDAP